MEFFFIASTYKNMQNIPYKFLRNKFMKKIGGYNSIVNINILIK